MKNPSHFTRIRRGLFLVCFAALSLISGCGKLRDLFSSTHKEPDNPHSVTIGWTASKSPVEGYNVYRATPSSGPVKLTPRLVSGTQYTDKTVEAGQTYMYSVTSVDFKAVESISSEKITVTVPLNASPPAKP
jgi:fibronectin type 3 domain-containing protein